ncbi:MAG: hypothetical protein JW720_11345 [Sedimentisphaerales bacterium]|nr:hypothetical protein [Sedimentisphaerales bacterium]
MDNNQIKFLGACIILGCSILAVSIGFVAEEIGEGAGVVGAIGVALAAYIGIIAWGKLGSSKDK